MLTPEAQKTLPYAVYSSPTRSGGHRGRPRFGQGDLVKNLSAAGNGVDLNGSLGIQGDMKEVAARLRVGQIPCLFRHAAGADSPGSVAQISNSIGLIALVAAQRVRAIIMMMVMLENGADAMTFKVGDPVRADLDGAWVFAGQQSFRLHGRAVGGPVVDGKEKFSLIAAGHGAGQPDRLIARDRMGVIGVEHQKRSVITAIKGVIRTIFRQREKSGSSAAARLFIVSTYSRVCIMSPPATKRSGRFRVAGRVRNRRTPFASGPGFSASTNSCRVSGDNPVNSTRRTCRLE